MDYKSLFKEKLSKLIFLEIDKSKFLKLLSIEEDIDFVNKDLFLPISSAYIAENIGDDIKINNLPIYYLVEGMFYSLGADKEFKYNCDYNILLKFIKDSEACIKSKIAKEVENKNYDEAYILLKGLISFDIKEEYIEKLLTIGEAIRRVDSSFKDIMLEDIDIYKEKYVNSPIPYLYESLILRDDEKFTNSYIAINEFVNKGGTMDKDIIEFKQELQDIVEYEKANEELNELPTEALKRLLPLLDKFPEDAIILFKIGVCYRRLENYEKAIYYLMESLRIDSAVVETVNEIGICFAMIGNHEEAIKYLRKAFDATRDVEICTNLIISYLNINDIKNAKLHLEIANKLNKEDEIVVQLNNILNNI